MMSFAKQGASESRVEEIHAKRREEEGAEERGERRASRRLDRRSRSLKFKLNLGFFMCVTF